MTNNALPEYTAPPTVETLMGFYFQKLPNPPWNVLRLGQLWQEFGPHYPSASTLPPIGLMSPIPVSFSNSFDVPVRANFLDEKTNQLIQVQDSAFFRNWKASGNREYAHFINLLPLFKNDWKRFVAFLETKQIPAPAVFLCEVTYVNHFVRNRDWKSFAELCSLFTPFAGGMHSEDGTSVLSNQVALTFSATYYLEARKVSLEINAAPITSPDTGEVFQLIVTAKGPASQDSDGEKWAMIDSCHEAVIRGFTEMITPAAQLKFGRSR
jgi:hypothetical protein